MKTFFNLEISSDLDYEGMVVNIIYTPIIIDKKKEHKGLVYKQELVAVLNQDKGIDNIEIKLYPPQTKEYWEFSYKEFMDILEKAKKMLMQINEKKNGRF